MSKSAEAVTMTEVVEWIAVVATVFAGQQVRDVTEFLWKSRPGPCLTDAAVESRGDVNAPSSFVYLRQLFLLVLSLVNNGNMSPSRSIHCTRSLVHM